MGEDSTYQVGGVIVEHWLPTGHPYGHHSGNSTVTAYTLSRWWANQTTQHSYILFQFEHGSIGPDLISSIITKNWNMTEILLTLLWGEEKATEMGERRQYTSLR